MNSSRINLLWAIRNAGETDYGSIGSTAMPSLVVASVALFVKLGMIEHTRGDNFQITSQGEECLDGLSTTHG
jgi:presenilin-like A22 family membrane protease